MNCKKLIALLCLFLFSSIVVNNDLAHASNKPISTMVAKDVNSEKYVSNDGDLILRDAAHSKGKKVTMLKKGSKVFVYSTDENGWSYVKQGKFKGYTLDKHLTIRKVNKSNSTQKANNSNTTQEVMDNHNLKIQKLENAIYEIQIKQMDYPKYSQEYRNLLEKELVLQKEKLNLINETKKALEKIINSK